MLGRGGWSEVAANGKASEVDWTLLREEGRQIREVARGCGFHRLASLTPKSALFNLNSSTFISTRPHGHYDKIVWDDMIQRIKEAQEAASHGDSLTESKS